VKPSEDTDMKKIHTNQNGTVSLEACIVVTLFIFFMLFLYSLFILFLAHNSIGHAILESSESLSLDSYYYDVMDKEADESVGGLIGEVAKNLFGLNGTHEYYSADNAQWANEIKPIDQSTATNDEKADYAKKVTEQQKGVAAAAKDRFIAYFANGDEQEAKQKLKFYKVVNGLDGLDFSESKIVDGDITITVKYQIDYEFNFFNVLKQNVHQSSKSKLWHS
jgi:hypothetical protein